MLKLLVREDLARAVVLARREQDLWAFSLKCGKG